MQHITGISRQQLQISSLEDRISPENPVRFIEAFVEYISLQALGFTVKTIKTEGRPSFDTKVFLKIYLYGYLGGVRSSRKLEKECVRNIELQWLLCGIVPNYHSISDFRKQNPSGLKKLFKLFVSFLKDADGFVPTYRKGSKNDYQLVVADKAWKKLKERLKSISCKTAPVKLEERIAKIKEVQRGWLNYFRGTNIMGKLRDLDGWLRNRLRYCIWHD